MASMVVNYAVQSVVSPVIKIMIGKVSSYLLSQLGSNPKTKSDLEDLHSMLMQVALAISQAETHRLTNPQQVELLNKMKDAVYDAEDSIDEFDYLLLKTKVSQPKSNMLVAITSSLRRRKNKWMLDEKFKLELRKVIETLERAKASATALLEVIRGNIYQPYAPPNIRATGSIICSDIIGREKDRYELINQILTHENQLPTILTIVGIGGMGKTALAQLIYNDNRVKNHFDLTMWISVWINFDKVELTKEILHAASHDKEITVGSLDMIQKELENIVKSKRFLLVLDDVWYDEKDNEINNKSRWKEIFAPLRSQKKGSKILVTTRANLVAKAIDASSTYNLEGLDSKKSWSLFKNFAFQDKTVNDYQDLHYIGKDIVSKLNGSPLALKVVGNQLNSNLNVEVWNRVLKSDLSFENDIMSVLRLSYDHLREHLQRCFAYCSLFPKGWHFNVDELVAMWIANGFVQPDGNKSLEDTGKDYFTDLLSRSFFLTVKSDDTKYYVMHNLLNELAVHVSHGEYFRLEPGCSKKIPRSIRHLSLFVEAVNRVDELPDVYKLRTLIFLKKDDCCSEELNGSTVIAMRMLKRFKRLRVLDLRGCCMKSIIPDTINQLIHMRFLALNHTSENYVNTLGLLYHLSFLTLCQNTCVTSYCNEVVLAESLSDLTNIIRINIHSPLYIIVDGISKIPNLHGSGLFCVSNKDGFRLERLHGINNLRGDLTIASLNNVNCEEEATKAQLGCNEHIKKLNLIWGDHYPRRKKEFAIEKNEVQKPSTHLANKVLEALRPHPHLEHMIISSYPGSMFPTWLGLLSRLRELELSECTAMEVLPPLGNLPSLCSLRLCEMSSLKRIGPGIYGGGNFPSLEKLFMWKLPQLKEWSCDTEMEIFPNLKLLDINRCRRLGSSTETPQNYSCLPNHLEKFPKLERLGLQDCDNLFALKTSDYATTLTDIKITNCNNLVRFPDLDNLPTLELLRLENCPKIKSLAMSGPHVALRKLIINGCNELESMKSLEELVSLRELEILRCVSLISLPKMDCFFSLETLKITYCYNLKSLPKSGLPLSLKELFLSQCHPALHEQFNNKTGPNWIKFDAIVGCLSNMAAH